MKRVTILLQLTALFLSINLYAKDCFYYANTKAELEQTKKAFCVEYNSTNIKISFYSDYSNKIIERGPFTYKDAITGGPHTYISDPEDMNNHVKIEICDEQDGFYKDYCKTNLTLENTETKVKESYYTKQIEISVWDN